MEETRDFLALADPLVLEDLAFFAICSRRSIVIYSPEVHTLLAAVRTCAAVPSTLVTIAR